MSHTPPLPVDGLGLDFREIGEPAQRVAIYSLLLRTHSLLEKLMSEATREATETRESFAVVKTGVNSAIGRLMTMVNERDATIAQKDARIAELEGLEVDVTAAKAISDATQSDMQQVADDLAKVGVPVDVPPPVTEPVDENPS